MARYVLEVMYDGALYHGSQIHGELPTVQLYLNQTISTIFRRTIETFGSSRTDEGVHALSNFYHFDLDEEPMAAFAYKCNAILPAGIAVKSLYLASNPEFNARFDALERQYRYRIYDKKNPFLHQRALFYPFTIDKPVLHETAAIIREYTHFESFSKRKTQSKTFICNIRESRWEDHEGELHYVVAANRFLRGMVRGLVATQLRVARGKLTTTDFRMIIETCDCKKAFFDVEGYGLYLEQVRYPDGALVGLPT